MRILKKIWWLPLVIYLIVMPAFMVDRLNDTSCRKIEINITDSLHYSFVTEEQVFSLIQNDSEHVLGEVLSEIEIMEIESRIARINELEKVEVYLTVDGMLHVEADQRDPLVRVITKHNNSYYIDKQGNIIPFNETFTPRLVVISGNIELPDDCISKGDINSSSEKHLIKQAYKIASYINKDEFWSSQIEQIWVNSKNEFELVPRAGRHIVMFGGQDGMETKFRNLKSFYLYTLPEIGWDRYREINLRYEGQIVGKKR